MLNLHPIIDRIKTLLDEDSDASVTYAALEARLALEKVVYDRLRQRHDYISHADLRGWNPNYVVNTIMAEVDPDVTETLTLAIGKHPGMKPEDDEFVDVGTEIGFDAAVISKMWNALAKRPAPREGPGVAQSQVRSRKGQCCSGDQRYRKGHRRGSADLLH